MSATVILNPYANRWIAGERKAELQASLEKAGLDFEIVVTEYPGHAMKLASEAAQAGNFPLIAAGGDGTFSEVVNGLLQAAGLEDKPAGPIGFIPFGTGNDLTDMLGIPRELDAAAAALAAGRTTIIDLGLVNGRYFDNNSAIGLEPIVTLENVRLTWLRGVVRYLVSALLAIMKNPSWDGEVEWDDGSYTGSLTLVSVGNSRRTGGTFYMTPNASLSDGFLDFVFAPKLNRRRLLGLLPKAQTGDHIHDPAITEGRTRKLTIRTSSPTPIQADGEVFEPGATEIVYEILPGALEVIVPGE